MQQEYDPAGSCGTLGWRESRLVVDRPGCGEHGSGVLCTGVRDVDINTDAGLWSNKQVSGCLSEGWTIGRIHVSAGHE